VLKGYVWGEEATDSYAAVAGRLSLAESTVRVVVHRMRKRFGDLLRLEVAHTVARPEDVEEEIRHFAEVLQD
jgi:hypothetical protein